MEHLASTMIVIFESAMCIQWWNDSLACMLTGFSIHCMRSNWNRISFNVLSLMVSIIVVTFFCVSSFHSIWPSSFFFSFCFVFSSYLLVCIQFQCIAIRIVPLKSIKLHVRLTQQLLFRCCWCCLQLLLNSSPLAFARFPLLFDMEANRCVRSAELMYMHTVC